jgi:hypothetical protein
MGLLVCFGCTAGLTLCRVTRYKLTRAGLQLERVHPSKSCPSSFSVITAIFALVSSSTSLLFSCDLCFLPSVILIMAHSFGFGPNSLDKARHDQWQLIFPGSVDLTDREVCNDKDVQKAY